MVQRTQRPVVYALALLATLCLSSCSGDDVQPPKQEAGESAAPGSLLALLATTGLPEPDALELPKPTQRTETTLWLTGAGRPAVQLVAVSERLWRQSAGESCDGVREDLRMLGSPKELQSAAAGTPDGPTQELLMGLYRAVASTIGVCNESPGRVVDTLPQLAWQWSLADRRLRELEVTP